MDIQTKLKERFKDIPRMDFSLNPVQMPVVPSIKCEHVPQLSDEENKIFEEYCKEHNLPF